MEIYVLKSAACLTLFFAFYKLFLERENMHIVKRFYLLGSLIASFVIPLITFTEYIAPTVQSVPIITSGAVVITNTEVQVATNYLPIILWTVYGLGLVIFGIRFGKNLYQMIQKIRRNPRHKNQNLFHVLLKTPVTPHTFFSYIFLHQQKFENNEIPKEVLDHEATHARELHSLDVLYIELIQVIFWFNPLLYFVKQSIKLNHEFLADRAVLSNGTDRSHYQKILLAFSSSASSPTMANSINYSSFKKRFTVMKTQTSQRGVWLRSLLLLPLLAGLIYSFSSTETIEKAEAENEILKTQEPRPDYTTTYLKGAARNNTKAFVLIVDQNKILLNGKTSSIETIANDLDNITKSWEEPDYTSTIPSILIKDSDAEFIALLNTEFRKTHYSKANDGYALLSESEPSLNNVKATPEQIAEYNKLARKYNNMPKDNMRVKGKELTRMRYIYDLMTLEQRRNAEPFPSLPPPPPAPDAPNPPKVIKGVNDSKSHLPPPPPPPAPKSPLDHVISMAKKGATFYYEGKKVSSDKAIEILKKNPNLNIDSRQHNSKNPQVRISKKPIAIEKSAAYYNGDFDKSDSQDPLIDLTDVIKKGATFYLNDKKISTERAIELTKKIDGIDRVEVVNGKGKNPKVYFWKKVKIGLKSSLKMDASTRLAHNIQESSFAVLYVNIPNIGPAPDYNNVTAMLDLMVEHKADLFLDGKKIDKNEALKLLKEHKKVDILSIDPKHTGEKAHFDNDGKPAIHFMDKSCYKHSPHRTSKQL